VFEPQISLGFQWVSEGAFVMAGTKADAKAETSGGGGGSFSEKGLAEKLNKLNSSAASIQSILVSVDLFLDRLQT
jgi:hypothetical protein